MRILLVPLTIYDGPYGDYTHGNGAEYYRAVTNQITQLVKELRIGEEVVVSPCGVTVKGRGSAQEIQLSQWGDRREEKKEDWQSEFIDQSRGSAVIFIRGGSWLERLSSASYESHSFRLLPEMSSLSDLMESLIKRGLLQKETPFALLDPLVSLDRKWVFLSPLKKGEERGKSEGWFSQTMRSENAAILENIIKEISSQMTKEDLSPSIGPQSINAAMGLSFLLASGSQGMQEEASEALDGGLQKRGVPDGNDLQCLPRNPLEREVLSEDLRNLPVVKPKETSHRRCCCCL